MEKLYYDRANKKFYVKELNTEKNGDILVVTDEQYVDVTDEIVELFQGRTNDGKQALCIDTTIPQLPDTVYADGKKFVYIGNPSPEQLRVKSDVFPDEGSSLTLRDDGESACGYLERCLAPEMRRVWYEACDEIKKAIFQECEKQKGGVEYVRKDTLLEWAEKRFEHYLQYRDDAVCYGERNAFQQMIDMLNSL